MGMNKKILGLAVLIISCITCFAQNKNQTINIPSSPNHDTAYYAALSKLITTRIYLSQKYTTFTLKAPANKPNLRYRPNTTLNLGVGATYRNITLNIALGFNVLNPDQGKGKTKYLDLQGHFFPTGWSLDWYGQFYKGFYLYPKGMATNSSENYYQRPDVVTNVFGITAYRILNHKKFSYRAAMTQNEWQKKSAGSWLLGGEINYGIIKADSAFVPGGMETSYPQAGINHLRFFSIGPGGGYAYTYVIKRNFFITGSVSLNLNLGFSSESGSIDKTSKTYITPTSLFRVAAGYNSNRWNISTTWVNNQVPVKGRAEANKYLFQTGNYRLIFARKFRPGKKLKTQLKKIDEILN
jgi:hypothetical protein